MRCGCGFGFAGDAAGDCAWGGRDVEAEKVGGGGESVGDGADGEEDRWEGGGGVGGL